MFFKTFKRWRGFLFKSKKDVLILKHMSYTVNNFLNAFGPTLKGITL